MNGSAAIAESCAFFAQQFPATSGEDDLRASGQLAKELRWDCHSSPLLCSAAGSVTVRMKGGLLKR
jgi:hypothetical protein